MDRELSSEAGRYYYRARYYDPTAGRFVSGDPIGFYGGTNFYRFVEDAPINLTDPFGLCPKCQVPPHPSDANVDDNMFQAKEHGYIWWYEHVSQWNGPWDYKNYHGQPHQEYDSFGNFNYGARAVS